MQSNRFFRLKLLGEALTPKKSVSPFASLMVNRIETTTLLVEVSVLPRRDLA